MKRAAVHNLGCKVNSYELDVMVQELKRAGYEIVSFDDLADVYIINTCSVTSIADRKSRQMLHRAKHRNPNAVVAAVGCYVETDRQKLEEDPLVDLCIGNNRKGSIARILTDYLNGTMQWDETMDDLTGHPVYEEMQLHTPGRTRADVKIQDGCNQFCTYCIIPYARGRIRSRDPEDVIREVQGLAADGVKEVVLTGIHISSYGKEKGLEPDRELLNLLRRLQLLNGIERIRLGSLEPRIITEDFAVGISGLSKVCPHFHLSLQSGCNDTLHRMNRHYTAEEYYEGVGRLRRVYDRPAITTDVIVGFQGETAAEFEMSRRFLEQTQFYEIHVFKYSVRRGTAAEHMPNPCSDEEKTRRSNVLLDLTAKQAKEYRRSFIGQQEELLLEEKVTLDGTEYFTGHTMRYTQGAVPAKGLKEGELVRGIITGLSADGNMLMMELS